MDFNRSFEANVLERLVLQGEKQHLPQITHTKLFVYHREFYIGKTGHLYGKACHSNHQKPAGPDL